MKKEELNEKNTKSKKNTTSKKNTATKKTEVKEENKKTTTNKAKQTKVASNKESEIKKKEKKVVLDEKVIEKKEPNKKSNLTSNLLLILVLIVVLVLGFVVMNGKKVEPSYELPLVLSGETGLHQLTYQEYQEKVDNDESFVIILERATCSHCVNYMPVAEKFATDNNVPMYYVDTDTFNEEDWTGFEKSNTFLKKNSNTWGTPTTIVLAGNEAVDYIEGETTAENLLELYNKYFEMDNE